MPLTPCSPLPCPYMHSLPATASHRTALPCLVAPYGYSLPHLALPCLALWHPVAALCHTQGELYVIDVSQAVDLDHPKALDFLREDCKHINDYFRRNGVQGQRRVLRKGCDTAAPAVLGSRHYYSNDAGLLPR